MASIWPEYRDKIAGGWKCISYEMFDISSGERKLLAKPHGDEPLGRVSISQGGWLAAHLLRPDRVNALKEYKALQEAPDAKLAHVARGTSMYCGYFQLFEDDEGGLYWQTKVEVSSDPNRVGGIEERKVILQEEDGKQYMILEPKQDMLLDVCIEYLKFAFDRPALTDHVGWHEDESDLEMGEVRIDLLSTTFVSEDHRRRVTSTRGFCSTLSMSSVTRRILCV